MQRSRIRVAVAASVAAAALALTGCSGGGASGSGGGDQAAAIAAVKPAQLKGVTIKLARFFGDCSDTVGSNIDLSKAVGECPTIQTLTNKFNAENRFGIKVERLGGAAWDSYYDTLNAAYAGGNPPDVAIMHGSSLVDYAKRGLLLPMASLVKSDGVDLSDAVAAAKTNISYDGQAYAVPFDIHGGLAHLNLDLWKKSGLTNADGTPKMPTSAAEFLADAKIMKEKTGKNFFATARSGDALGVHFFQTLVEQQGGDVLNAAGTSATIDTPQAKTALAFMNKLFSEYADGKQTYDAAQQSFLNGDVGMLFNGTWVVDSNAAAAKGKFTYEAASFPTLYQKAAVWADGHTWVIPKHKNGDPVKYRAALEFTKYLYAHDIDWALGTGHISARTSVLNSAAYKAAPQRANYASTGTTVAHPVPHIANWPAVSDQLVKSIESIWFQGANVDTALKNGDASIDALLTK